MSDFVPDRIRYGVPAGGEFAPRSLPDGDTALTLSGPTRQENFQVAKAEFEQAQERLLVAAADLLRERALAAFPDADTVHADNVGDWLRFDSITDEKGKLLTRDFRHDIEDLVAVFPPANCSDYGWVWDSVLDHYGMKVR